MVSKHENSERNRVGRLIAPHFPVLSSRRALTRIETSITSQIEALETVIAQKTESLTAGVAQMEASPKKLMRRIAILSAGIGAMIAMIPWGVMTYLGMSVTGEAQSFLERRAMIRAEEDRITAMGQIEIATYGSETVVMLPATVTQLYTCGIAQTPCIKLEE